jgi:methylenetetrahydrofolate--tRNA-(uracil-5-)-methyltransferase
MHRNTFIQSPVLLEDSLRYAPRAPSARQHGAPLYFAGQIVGVEGYAGNAATGLLAGINAARAVAGKAPVAPPPSTMTRRARPLRDALRTQALPADEGQFRHSAAA